MSNALSERSESKGCRELLSMFFVYVARCADGTLYVGENPGSRRSRRHSQFRSRRFLYRSSSTR